MDSNGVEIQKRDSYWANNPRTRFGRTLYKTYIGAYYYSLEECNAVIREYNKTVR